MKNSKSKQKKTLRDFAKFAIPIIDPATLGRAADVPASDGHVVQFFKTLAEDGKSLQCQTAAATFQLADLARHDWRESGPKARKAKAEEWGRSEKDWQETAKDIWKEQQKELKDQEERGEGTGKWDGDFFTVEKMAAHIKKSHVGGNEKPSIRQIKSAIRNIKPLKKGAKRKPAR